MFELDGKIALLTGGSRGLGLQIAAAFAERGATVVISSRKQDACDAAAEQIAAATGATVLGIACHVGHWDQCDRLIERVYEQLGRLDVLVNNAGSSPPYSSLDAVSEELFDKVIAVNLKGHFRLCALAGTRMVAAGGGSIVNVSSTASVSPSPAEVPYGAAKAGLSTLTVGFARAFAPSVRVNTIVPGPFLTDISKAWDMQSFEQLAERAIPLKRGGRPEEIVGAAVYLASDASSYVTGSAITLDGGLTSSRG
jgi:NAD(P)-dependent dehydrogenase (short-subunit alcohol dehydrogenase family)